MPGVRQTSFSGGELDPRFHGRTDLKIYEAGAARLENFIPTPYGSVVSRPGTYFINRTKTDQEVRLIPFNYSDDGSQNYVLEFGNLYVRFHQVAGTVESSPGVPYEVVTPYVTADLPKLKYVQVGDVLTIVHGSYAPRELTRAAHTSWALSLAVIGVDTAKYPTPSVAPFIETNASFYPTIDATHPGKAWKWCVTLVYADGTESLPSPYEEAANTADATSGMIACYTDRPVYLLMPPSGGAVRYRVYKGRSGVFGYVGSVTQKTSITYTSGLQSNGYWFVDEGIEPDYTTNPPIDQNPFVIPAWTSWHRYAVGERVTNGGNVYECIVGGFSSLTGGPSGTGTNIADGPTAWAANTAYVANNLRYNRGRTFYCATPGTSAVAPTTGPWGYWQSVGGFTDGTVVWNLLGDGQASAWKYLRAVADQPNVYPATVAIFEQRRIFGGTAEEPAMIYGSRTDRWNDFTASTVLQATDRIQFELAAKRREQIRSLASLRHLMTMTGSSEWVVGGAANGDPMSPFSIRARVHGERGSSFIDPLVVGNTLIHVQPKGTIIRDLYFDVNVDSYVGNELSFFSKHLFEGHEVVSWCYAEDPYSIVWAVLDDGTIVSMTYVREQELFAWARHSSQGVFTQVCSIPDVEEDAVFQVVLRGTSRCIELMASRNVQSITEFHCVDSGIVDTSAGLVISGLDHLDGQYAAVVLNETSFITLLVSGGSVTLPGPETYASVRVGLTYECTFESLDVAPDKERTKIVREALVEVLGSGGFWVGENPSNLVYWSRWPTATGVATGQGTTPLSTGTARVTISNRWGLGGRVAVQQRDPMPLTITAIQRELVSGGV